MPPTPVHPGVGQSRHHAVPEGFWGSKAMPRAGGRDPICRIGHWGRPGSVAALQVPEWTPLTPGRYGQAWWRCVTSLPVRLLLVESLGRTSVPLMDLGHPPAPLKGHGASLGQPTAMATPGLQVFPSLILSHLWSPQGGHRLPWCSAMLQQSLRWTLPRACGSSASGPAAGESWLYGPWGLLQHSDTPSWTGRVHQSLQ